MNRIRVLGRTSSINVRKVLWLCVELGLPVEQQDYGRGAEPTDTVAFRALNPNATIPVIVDGDVVLWESNTICRYLAGREHRHDLLPAEPAARAAVEQWMDWQATDLNAAWRYAYLARVHRSPVFCDEAAIERSVAEWNRAMVIFDGQLQRSGGCAAGPHFTLADIVLGLSVNRWRMTPMERPHLAAVDAYFERLAERPGFRQHGNNGMP